MKKLLLMVAFAAISFSGVYAYAPHPTTRSATQQDTTKKKRTKRDTTRKKDTTQVKKQQQHK